MLGGGAKQHIIEKGEQKPLEKFLFRCFRNSDGFVIMTNSETRRVEMEKLIYLLFKDQYPPCEQPIMVYVHNQVW